MNKLDLLTALLTWINTPWKLIGFVLTVVILGGAYTAYQYRDTIIQSYISQGNVSMDVTKIPEVTSFLQERSEVKDVYIWSVDLESNRRWLAHGTGPMPKQTSFQLFSDSMAQVRNVVMLLDAQLACDDLNDKNLIFDIYSASGAKYFCSVAVPPYMGKFLGIIVVTMDEKPTDAQMGELKARLKLSSAMLTKTD
ncbi:MAG: hypothetical protein [Caudoviricetes sp.]|nr:MAG: hypothetical protein [Caudoviricetes sp.]